MTKKRFYSKPGRSALERFAEKCAFDPFTGCVMWIGGQTKGQGHTQPYGRFWDGEKMVLAHRWSAEHIHGFEIDGLQVDHCCPAGPSTLCVHHIKPEPAAVNRELQNVRPGRAYQDLATKHYWVLVQVGEEPEPIRIRDPGDIPFYLPPLWLSPFLPKLEIEDDCPF